MRVKLKRLKMNKLFRAGLILAIILISGALSFLLYKELKIPTFKEEKVNLYSYTYNTSTDYKVLLKPNSLYNSPSLGEGKYYIKYYTDTVQTTFNYEFKGEREVDLKGDYEVTAVVEGYKDEEDKHITIWEKNFAIFPKTELKAKDDILTLTKNVNLKLSEYNDFVDAIVEESEVQTSMQLIVYMNVNLKGSTDKGQFETKVKPSITIPLGESYFSITEGDTKEVPGSIEETRSIIVPPNKQKVILYECVLGLLVLVILILLIFTEAIKKSPFTMKLDKIFKLYGNRLVALNSELLAASLDNCNIVRSMDDLVRVADEIGRPIMYEYSEDYKDIVHFYVLDEKRTYLYVIKDNSTESNVVIVDEKKVVL